MPVFPLSEVNSVFTLENTNIIHYRNNLYFIVILKVYIKCQAFTVLESLRIFNFRSNMSEAEPGLNVPNVFCS